MSSTPTSPLPPVGTSDYTCQVKYSGFLEKSPPGVRHPDTSLAFAKWELRFFELAYLREEDLHVLRYYENEKRSVLKRTIELGTNCLVTLVSDVPSEAHENTFCLKLPKRMFFCSAASAKIKDKWTTELRKACPHLVMEVEFFDSDNPNAGGSANPKTDRILYDKSGTDAFNGTPTLEGSTDADVDNVLWGGGNKSEHSHIFEAEDQYDMPLATPASLATRIPQAQSPAVLKADPRRRAP